MRLSIPLIAALALSAVPAQACRVMRPPLDRIGGAYQSKIIASVAHVRVVESRDLGQPRGDAKPWEATARVERVVRGSNPVRKVRFSQGWGSAACDLGYGRPQPGDRWAAYFWNHPEKGQQVWLALPLQVSDEIEGELRKRHRAR
ncbi:hypothetical protein [Sphingomonas sp. MS122]|uniref:hypothetical protein n=1 Tax=Sphingomonas sp. MS122 TaxID=3412683 RepID=UPI003C30BE85